MVRPLVKTTCKVCRFIDSIQTGHQYENRDPKIPSSVHWRTGFNPSLEKNQGVKIMSTLKSNRSEKRETNRPVVRELVMALSVVLVGAIWQQPPISGAELCSAPNLGNA